MGRFIELKGRQLSTEAEYRGQTHPYVKILDLMGG